MKVRVLRSFAARLSEHKIRQYTVGEIVELPPWFDWEKAGLVERLPGEEPDPEPEEPEYEMKAVRTIEEAVLPEPEKAVTRVSKRRRK